MGLIKRDMPPREGDERKDDRSRERLLAQLNAQDAAERRWAARDLAGFNDVSEALHHRLEIEDEPSVRAVLFSALTQSADAKAVAGLIALLRSEDAGLRNGSIAALKCLPGEAGAHVEALLRDDDPDVRIFAVNILESLPHPDVARWLCRVIEEDTHVNVCAAAVDLLTEMGTPDMVPALQAVKDRFADTPFIAFAVDLTVERIGATEVVETRA